MTIAERDTDAAFLAQRFVGTAKETRRAAFEFCSRRGGVIDTPASKDLTPDRRGIARQFIACRWCIGQSCNL